MHAVASESSTTDLTVTFSSSSASSLLLSILVLYASNASSLLACSCSIGQRQPNDAPPLLQSASAGSCTRHAARTCEHAAANRTEGSAVSRQLRERAVLRAAWLLTAAL